MIYIISTNTCFWLSCPISQIENYNKIYEIKNRQKDKAIAIMVSDFDYFEQNTKLTLKQIEFLKNYKNPWTILIDKEKICDKNLLKIISSLDNSEIYIKIAFRVAHTFMHRRLIEEKWPLFLTSANKSTNPELFDTISVKKEFEKEIKENKIRVFAHNDYYIKSEKNYSDIFEFEDNSLEINYLRK